MPEAIRRTRHLHLGKAMNLNSSGQYSWNQGRTNFGRVPEAFLAFPVLPREERGHKRQMNNKQKDKRCRGKTTAGKPCRAAATDGGLCFFHSNPQKAAELGRIGGRRNRYVFADPDSPPLAIESAKEVRNSVSRLINDVYSGKLSPRIAAGLGPLLNLQLRAIEATDVEQRLAKLEQEQSQLRATASAQLADSEKANS